MSSEPNDSNNLKRQLKNRHIQLIALGGAIGTGLFLGSAPVIKLAGPSVLLSYALCGFIAFLIMRQLGEMITQEPIVGSFSNIAKNYLGDFAGFLSGWNYYALYILVGMTELLAISNYVQYWFPGIEKWQSTMFFFILINIMNLATVKIFGELEFWFSSIKIFTIISTILFGIYLLTSGKAGEQAGIQNLYYTGFFANGFKAFFMSMALVMFSFGGLELIGITAAETDNPQKSIPKAINQIIYRVLIFYVGAIFILLVLYPWDQVVTSRDVSWSQSMELSPFVSIFTKIGFSHAANILNFVILTASLSVYNGCVYCNSRMLYGLAIQKNAPAIFAKANKRGVPVNALLLSSSITLIGVYLNYKLPESALSILYAVVIASLVINWTVISVTQLFFRKSKEKSGEKIIFKSPFFPYSNYFCLFFMAAILYLLVLLDMKWSVIMMPIWIIIIVIGYSLKKLYLKKRSS